MLRTNRNSPDCHFLRGRWCYPETMTPTHTVKSFVTESLLRRNAYLLRVIETDGFRTPETPQYTSLSTFVHSKVRSMRAAVPKISRAGYTAHPFNRSLSEDGNHVSEGERKFRCAICY
ncbi:hypothetical protein K438DRAFT_11404 [Mycena galopus ATCC 62051]|nr:hypothetical protein K438DRAFT_11404 [Mycena galopus ATCC 62051]